MSIVTTASPKPTCAAHCLTAKRRIDLALNSLDERCCISHLAVRHNVSRQFAYRLQREAHDSPRDAFDPPAGPDELLFYLPVTKPWLRSLALGLVLLCHSSYRGVTESLADLFDHHISIGTVRNILSDAAGKAAAINTQQDLSFVRIAALDEIFQAGMPVLAAADVNPSYCRLLGQEDPRDADTWGVRLLESQGRGFAPRATIADFGSGLRAGAKAALPDVPCRADIFHPPRDFLQLSTYLDNRAYDAISCHEDLMRKQQRHTRRHAWKDRSIAAEAALAGRAVGPAVALADEVRTLLCWWQNDVLAVAGDGYATRRVSHDWIVEESRAREGRFGRTRAARVLLEKHGGELLAFAEELDAQMSELAARFEVSEAVAREALACCETDEARPSRWVGEEKLWRQLGGKYARPRVEVRRLAAGVVRASSVIENLNSRLRNYFFLRKQLGNGYLGLLQSYLNHHRFERSERQERQGKSPREPLSGQEHSHWLELLGYQRFSQAA